MDQQKHSRRVSRRAPFGLAVVLGALVAIGVPSAALAWTDYAFSASSETEMITLINQARASAGLPALVEIQSLTDIARWRSKDMYDRSYFSHAIPDGPGGMVFDEIHRQDICYTLAGENIGYNNYPDDVATQTMFNGWMQSPEHRALILGSGFNRIGLGAFKGTNASYPRHYWTAVFTHTCKSATPKPTPEPTRAPKVSTTAISTSARTPVRAAEPARTADPDILLLGDALYAVWRDIVRSLG